MSPEPTDNLRLRIAVSGALILLLLLLGAGALAGLASLRKEPAKGDRTVPRTVVRVVDARIDAYEETLRGYGRARALRTAEVSAEVSGVIAWISDDLEAGAPVAANAELVRLDTRDYETALATARARQSQANAMVEGLEVSRKGTNRRLELARKDLESAERELERVRELARDEVVTQSELDRQRLSKSLSEKEVVTLEVQLDSTEQELIRAKAEVDAAKAVLGRAELDLVRTTIRAPFAGRIVERRVSPGTRVVPGGVLVTIVDLSRVEIPVALGASRYGEVTANATARVRLRDGSDVVWSGEVSRISPIVDDRDRTFSAFLVIPGTPLSNPVPPGSFVLAEIVGRRYERVMAIPRIAFVGDRIYLADGTAPDAAVTTRVPGILRMLPSTALVSGGLEPGERVIVTNLEQIAEGATVRVVREDTKE